jgi:hypothetical protein
LFGLVLILRKQAKQKTAINGNVGSLLSTFFSLEVLFLVGFSILTRGRL